MYRFSCVEFGGDSSATPPRVELICDKRNAPNFIIITLGCDLSPEEIEEFPPKEGDVEYKRNIRDGKAINWIYTCVTTLGLSLGKLRELVAIHLSCPLNKVEIETC